MNEVVKSRIIVFGTLAASLTAIYLIGRRIKEIDQFDPWDYDLDGDGVISMDELEAAEQDWLAGVITRSQYLEVLALYFDAV